MGTWEQTLTPGGRQESLCNIEYKTWKKGGTLLQGLQKILKYCTVLVKSLAPEPIPSYAINGINCQTVNIIQAVI